MSELEWILTCECSWILNDATDCCSSRIQFTYKRATVFFSLKPLVNSRRIVSFCGLDGLRPLLVEILIHGSVNLRESWKRAQSE